WPLANAERQPAAVGRASRGRFDPLVRTLQRALRVGRLRRMADECGQEDHWLGCRLRLSSQRLRAAGRTPHAALADARGPAAAAARALQRADRDLAGVGQSATRA